MKTRLLPVVYALALAIALPLASPARNNQRKTNFEYRHNRMTTAQENVSIKQPVAKKSPKTTTINGDTLVDDYFWMREKNNPEVLAYLEAENAYTDALMKPTEGFQDSLYKEMVGRIKETDVNVPYKNGDYFYYSRTEQGKQYPILCRKRGSLDAKEEVYLDLNEL